MILQRIPVMVFRVAAIGSIALIAACVCLLVSALRQPADPFAVTVENEKRAELSFYLDHGEERTPVPVGSRARLKRLHPTLPHTVVVSRSDGVRLVLSLNSGYKSPINITLTWRDEASGGP